MLVVKLRVRVKNRSSKVTVSSKVTCRGKELKLGKIVYKGIKGSKLSVSSKVTCRVKN